VYSCPLNQEYLSEEKETLYSVPIAWNMRKRVAIPATSRHNAIYEVENNFKYDSACLFGSEYVDESLYVDAAGSDLIYEKEDYMQIYGELNGSGFDEQKVICITGDDYKKSECGVLMVAVSNYDDNFYKAIDRGKERYYKNEAVEGEDNAYGFIDDAIVEELRASKYEFDIMTRNFGLYQL
jgi:hypothetical protein